MNLHDLWGAAYSPTQKAFDTRPLFQHIEANKEILMEGIAKACDYLIFAVGTREDVKIACDAMEKIIRGENHEEGNHF